MKRIIVVFLISCFVLAACGSFDDAAPDSATSAPEKAWEEAWEEDEWAGSTGFNESVEMESDSAVLRATSETGADDSPPASGAGTSITRASTASQIIYWADAEILTEYLDETVDLVNELIDSHEGFIEQSNITGRSYNYWQNNRSSVRRAEFTIRVPGGNYHQMVDELPSLGELLSLDTTATNVSGQYADVTSRLTALRVQEERLLELLEDAANLTEILQLEDRLGEIIQQIEWLTAERNNLGSQIAYSTIHVTIWETEEIIIEDSDSWTASAALSGSLRAMGTFGRGAVIFFAASLPWLIVFAIIALPIVMLIRRRRRQKKDAAANTPNITQIEPDHKEN